MKKKKKYDHYCYYSGAFSIFYRHQTTTSYYKYLTVSKTSIRFSADDDEITFYLFIYFFPFTRYNNVRAYAPCVRFSRVNGNGRNVSSGRRNVSSNNLTPALGGDGALSQYIPSLVCVFYTCA